MGDGLVYDGSNVVIGDVGPFSALGEIPAGAVVTGVNGRDLSVLDADGVTSYFADNPLGVGERHPIPTRRRNHVITCARINRWRGAGCAAVECRFGSVERDGIHGGRAVALASDG